jgi:nucleotide-binding universal stress UspA family protein
MTSRAILIEGEVSSRSTGVPFESIIVPLDGSALAEQALPVAETIARGGGHMVLVRAHDAPVMAFANGEAWGDETRWRESNYLASVAATQATPGGAAAETLVVNGPPAEAIRTTAEGRPRALIVMTSHGRTGARRVWLGSVADAVLGRTNGPPVFLVRAAADGAAGPSTIRKILVPLDGSVASEAILPHAAALARMCGAGIELVRVVVPDDIAEPVVTSHGLDGDVPAARDELRRIATRVGAELAPLVVRSTIAIAEQPAKIIVAAARAWGCDVVAMTTRASGLTRLVVGSVADHVIRFGPRLLLLVRPSDARHQENP